MHNLFSCQSISMSVWQTLIAKDTPAVTEFMSMFSSLSTLVGNGEIAASMSSMRHIINVAAALCETTVLGHVQYKVRVFAYILRFAIFVAQQIYSRPTVTPSGKLALSVTCTRTFGGCW